MAASEAADQERAEIDRPQPASTPLLLRGVGLKTAWDQRRSIFWWSGGAAVLSAVVVLVYPSITAGPEMEQLIEQMPPAIRALMGEEIDLTTVHGYLNLRLFTFIAPIIFLIYAIGRGTAAIAGEEDRGTMDLLLSNPVRRSRIVVETFAILVAGLIVIGLGLWLGTVVGALIVDVHMSFNRAAQATLMGVLLATAYGALALALSAGTGRTGLAIGISTAVGVAGYLLHTLAPLVDWLEPFQILSPFYFYINDPAILQGMNPGHAAVLVALSLILLLIAVLTFQRRDVQV